MTDDKGDGLGKTPAERAALGHVAETDAAAIAARLLQGEGVSE